MVLIEGLVSGAFATIIIIGICTLIEQVSVIERYSLRARLPGLAMNIVQKPLTIMVAWPLSQVWHSFAFGKFITIPLWTILAPLGLAAYAIQFVVVVAAEDFLVYWRHRFEHKAFWHVHAVHHAPTELFGANDLGHPLQAVFGLIFVSFPLSLIQFSGPATPAAVSAVVLLLSYYIHSPIDVHFGPLRKVLVDNRFHRIHHSIEPRHFDKNFGVCFSLWDRWFGTAYDPAPDEWPDVGLVDIPAPRTITDYLMLPFRRPAKQHAGDPAANDACLTQSAFATSSPKS